MEENLPSEEPKLIKTIEETLQSIVNGLLYFPIITFRILFYPKKLFSAQFEIKPLTYFSVSLLLASPFWHLALEPSKNFTSPVMFYLEQPDFTELKVYLLDTKVLTNALVGLIPIVVGLLILVHLICLLFRIKTKKQDLLRFTFYLSGHVLVMVPTLMFLTFSIAFLHFIGLGKFYVSHFMEPVADVTLGLEFLLFIRVAWVASMHFFTPVQRILYLKPILLSAIMLGVCYLTVQMIGLFYSKEKNPVLNGILLKDSVTALNDTSKHFFVKFKVVISNVSDEDKVIMLDSITLSAKRGMSDFSIARGHFSAIIEASEPLKKTMVLKHNAALYFEIPFQFTKEETASFLNILQKKEPFRVSVDKEATLHLSLFHIAARGYDSDDTNSVPIDFYIHNP